MISLRYVHILEALQVIPRQSIKNYCDKEWGAKVDEKIKEMIKSLFQKEKVMAWKKWFRVREMQVLSLLTSMLSSGGFDVIYSMFQIMIHTLIVSSIFLPSFSQVYNIYCIKVSPKLLLQIVRKQLKDKIQKNFSVFS